MFKFKEKIRIMQIVSLIKGQIEASDKNNPNWHKNFGSKYVLGYIYCLSVMLLEFNVEKINENFEDIFNELFGKKSGSRILKLAEKSSEDSNFEKGTEQAIKDLDIIEKRKKPTSLTEYLNKT